MWGQEERQADDTGLDILLQTMVEDLVAHRSCNRLGVRLLARAERTNGDGAVCGAGPGGGA